MPKKLSVLAMVVVFSALAAASRPSSIVGTWMGVANQTAVQLVITTQTTVTAPCKPITGTLNNLPSGGASNIQGFYCPGTGRFSFVRKDITTNDTFQSYSGNVSNTGTTLRMTGVFEELNLMNALGEYNFSVTK
jgi:hypothetical protein